MSKKNTLITTIIPVYKVEKYLREAIDSIIGQDIGFEDSIEIVLVNDGSPDGSGEICKEYRDRYPKNIKYIEQKNKGVSTARNVGLAVAKTKYVHFLDSDDFISKNAYSEALKLLKENDKSIDFAALKLEMFEARVGDHPLNGKFKGNRVIDVDSEPSSIILHLSSCIVRRSAIKTAFDSKIKISEDMRLISEILLEKKKYGVISNAHYYYRKRLEDNSAIDSARLDPSFYQVTPYRVYEYVLSLWKTESGSLHPYAQWVVMYDLQWRLRQNTQKILDEPELARYKRIVHKLIGYIDDSVIIAQQHIEVPHKEYALRVKHGLKNSKDIPKKWPQLYRNFRPNIYIEFVDFDKKSRELTFQCSVQNGSSALRVRSELDSKLLKKHQLDIAYRKELFLGETVTDGDVFEFSIKAKDAQGDLKFYYDGSTTPLTVLTRRFSYIPNIPYGYRILGGRVIWHQRNGLNLAPYSKGYHFKRELQWGLRILLALRLKFAAGKFRTFVRATARNKMSLKEKLQPFLLPPISLVRNIGTVLYRLAYYLAKPFVGKRPIWIVSDRAAAAGDNGEALYGHIMQRNNSSINLYFALGKDSPDYKKLKKRGFRMLNNNSLKYRLLFLHSSKIISSHADDYVINPFKYRIHFLNDLLHFDYVFLQHGVIRNDLSSWLNRYNKDIRLFVTSTKREHQSMLEYPYYYAKEKILLSGLPRYDLLENQPQSKLILAPTWRHHIALRSEVSGGQRVYDPEFKDTDYFKFYNRLMSNKRLLSSLADHGMTGDFYLHPSFKAQIDDFDQSERFTIKQFPYDYKTAFREGSVLVSDYSSVIFDFLYLGKPIVYSQFDQDTFYENHIYTRGYMDDETEGFGPVTKNIKDTVDAIISILEAGCTMEPVYKKRVQKFFTWQDKNNSKRVYEAILKLDRS